MIENSFFRFDPLSRNVPIKRMRVSALLGLKLSARRYVRSFGDILCGALKHLHYVIEVMGVCTGLVVCGQPEQALGSISSLHASITAPFATHQ